MLGLSSKNIEKNEKLILENQFKTLTNRMISKIIELQKEAGFDISIAQATSAASRQYLRIQDFQQISICRYDTYQCPILGIKPFVSLGEDYCELSVKDLHK